MRDGYGKWLRWSTASRANWRNSSSASGTRISPWPTVPPMHWSGSRATGPRGRSEGKGELLRLMAEAEEKKLCWNLALVVPRLQLTIRECRRAAAAMHSYLDDRSSIVRTAALHGLADLTQRDSSILPDVLDLLRVAGRSGTPAMGARSRILLEIWRVPQGRARKRARRCICLPESSSAGEKPSFGTWMRDRRNLRRAAES